MDGMIKVSPELLISTAGEFSNQGTTINTLTGEMLQLATGLASAWRETEQLLISQNLRD